jgi:hypothetical protein
MRRIVLLTLRLLTLLALFTVTALSRPATKQKSKKGSSKLKLPGALTSSEKLQALIQLMTSAEIAVAAGCSVRAIEERRKQLNKPIDMDSHAKRSSKTDEGIDNVYSLAYLLENRYKLPPHNVRAWFIGRSAYLDEQRPASLLSSGEFELVREAAIAYATSESPDEFLERVGPVVRVPDPVET